MSVKATSWAWAQVGLGPMPKLVLVALADFANPEGKCWPGQAQLVLMTDSSVRTVRRNLDALIELGLVERVKRSTTKGRLTDCYQLAMEDPGHSATGQIGRLRNRPDSTDLPATVAGCLSLSSNRQEPSKEREDLTEAFEAFWAVYPNRAHRGAAEKKWRVLVGRGVKPADLVAGARRYAAETAGTERRYIRHASTWLNNDGWKDEPVLPAFGMNGSPRSVSTRIDPPDSLIAEWSEAGVADEDLPARISEWRAGIAAGLE